MKFTAHLFFIIILPLVSLIGCKDKTIDPYIESVTYAPSQAGSIGLYNPNEKAFEISGWILRDPLQSESYVFPENTTLAPLAITGWGEGVFPFSILDTLQTIQLLDPSGDQVHSYSKE